MWAMDPQIAAYAEGHTTPPEGVLAEVVAATLEEMPRPGMMSGLPESRLLEALVVVSGARRVLEVGTFTGVGALSMAACLPDDGEVVTIERDEAVAEIARRNIDRSPHGKRVRLIVGEAHDVLGELDGPFGLVYLDAWKVDYVSYYEAVLPKLAPRGVIVADNVLWRGHVLEEDPQEPETRGVMAFNEHVQRDERVRNVMLTVGDGVTLIWRADAAS